MSTVSTRRRRWLLRGTWLAAIVVFCVLWPAWEFPHFIIPKQLHAEALVQLALFHGAWLLVPLLVQSGFIAFARFRQHRKLRATGATVLAVVCALLIYARFVEPALLVVRRTVIPAPVDLDIALVADVHIGRFTRPAKLRQVVDRLNRLHVDLVLFAGDFTYGPPRDLAAALAPLRDLNAQVYAVLGNHDEQLPGPPVADRIRTALAGSPVHFIAHRVVEFPDFRLAGLYDWWTARDDAAFLRNLPPGKPLLILMHQPHSLRALRGVPFALAMAGHTHGGQVYIPWLTREMFLRIRDEKYVNGYYVTPEGKLFVTPGVGVTGMPLRLDCPPTIDVLELRRHAD